MKPTATTRWEYYVANIVGIIAIVGLLVWFGTLAVTDAGLSFTSVYFWLSILLLFLLPYTFISFFSSMKEVEVTDKGIVISYVFQKHKNNIRFSEISKMDSSIDRNRSKAGRFVQDNFKLALSDGRAFEFSRSQLNGYDQLKSACRRKIKG